MPRKLPLPMFFIALIFVVHHAVSFRKSGIRYGGDTPRYTEGAQRLLTHQPFVDKEASYIGYVAFVALCDKFLGGVKAVIFLQIFISFLALIVAFKIASSLGGYWAGVVTALLMATNPDLVQWNLFILTDSLYMSFIVFSTYLVWKATENPKVWILPAGLSVLMTVLIRPTGWVLLPALIVFSLTSVPSLFKFRKWAFFGLLVLFILPFTVPRLKKAVEAERPALKIQFGEIICEYHDYLIAMPQEPGLVKGGIESAVTYVLVHPLSVLKLGMARILAVLIHARPYYSRFHNLQIFFMVFPTYLLAFFGFYFCKKPVLQKLGLTFIAFHLLLISISFADWDGRYLMHFFPLFQLFAGSGFVFLWEKLRLQRLQYQL